MAHHTEQKSEHSPHGSGYGQLLLIWFGLLALTGLTVALAGINLGRWIIVTALTIAGVKTVLVVNVFMHLRSEEKVFRVFVAVAVLTFTIFIVLTFFDYAFH
jgi:cytochrome c oxidase subunit 4